MKILLVYPQYEETFWNLKRVLKILGKRAAYPPLGLLTISAMLPKDWDRKLIDLNCQNLEDDHISWADYVFISAMIGQKESAVRIIETAKKMGKPVVCGGPLFTTSQEQFSQADTIFLGEAEDTFPVFIRDLKNGTLKKIYSSKVFPDIKVTPAPDWDLINLLYYNSMCIQLSRGCPYSCEFCEVEELNGRVSRLKSIEQLISELESMYQIGWKAGVFVVDDNFIGNRKKLKKTYLPAVIEWQKRRRYPFVLSCQVSIDLSDDIDLMELMAEAGFSTVFVGIETPDPDSLSECRKNQNRNRDMVKSVKIIQNMGFEVNAGFILGFDSDKPSIFSSQIDFIQKSGIVTAMVSLLAVRPKTRLYQRLKEENRLIEEVEDNTCEISALNFIPRMDTSDLISGYSRVISTIYSPQFYYRRVRTFLQEFRPKKIKRNKIGLYHIRALIGSIWFLGLMQAGRVYYWKVVLWSLFKKPGLLPYAIGLPLGLIHFRDLAWIYQYYSYFRDN